MDLVIAPLLDSHFLVVIEPDFRQQKAILRVQQRSVCELVHDHLNTARMRNVLLDQLVNAFDLAHGQLLANGFL